jgi:hypothetical protein
MDFSTSEVEYTADVITTKESQWLCQILQDCGFLQHNPTTFFYNNQSIIKLSKNIRFHDCSKHIEIKYHYLKKKVES